MSSTHNDSEDGARHASGSQSPSATAATKAHSCVTCYQRKVKCDKKEPCSNCSKSGAECVYRDPAPPKRGKRKHEAEEEIHAKVRRLEVLLEQAGVVHEFKGDGRAPGPPSRPENSSIKLPSIGKLIQEDGRARYIENHLWQNLSEELRGPNELLPDSPKDSSDAKEAASPPSQGFDESGVNVILGLPPGVMMGAQLPWIQPAQASCLWTVFLENVNPLTKVIHVPTHTPILAAGFMNPDKLRHGEKALLMCTLMTALHSLNDQQAESQLGESKQALWSRLHFHAQTALINANILKSSNLNTLRAFVLYVLTLRTFNDGPTIWTLSGVSIRIGQRLGLHRDGSILGLSVFETEMRRRLWWQMLMLEGHSTEVAGGRSTILAAMGDTQIPANVDDAELFPDMKEFPTERLTATEMINFSMRCEFGKFRMQKEFEAEGATMTTWDAGWTKHHIIDKVEKRLEERYLRYCDPLIPIQFLCIIVARTAICSMRIRASHPSRRPDKDKTMTQEEKDMLFTNSLKSIEYDDLIKSTPSMQGFMWHIDQFFQWNAFIYMVSELRQRKSGPEVDKAWKQVENVYKHRPEMLQSTGKDLNVAIGNLVLKVWKERELELKKLGFPVHRPVAVQQLIHSRRGSKISQTLKLDDEGASALLNPPHSIPPHAHGNTRYDPIPRQPSSISATSNHSGDWDFSLDPTLMESPMSWEDWDNLLIGSEFVPMTMDHLAPPFMNTNTAISSGVVFPQGGQGG